MSRAHKHSSRKAKKNAVLELRLPDELKAQFLAQCRKDGVTASEVLRGFIAAHIRARRQHLAFGRWIRSMPMVFRRHRFKSGFGLTGLVSATLLMVIPVQAGAEDFAIDMDVQVLEQEGYQTSSSRVETTVQISEGEPYRFEFPHADGDMSPEFAVEISAARCVEGAQACPDGGLDIQMEITRLIDGEVLSRPRFLVETGQPASLSIMSEVGASVQVAVRADAVVD